MINSASFKFLAVFLMVVILTIVSILYMNNGMFTYMLDDPYIHLAMSENIMKGHYGVNLTEHSAPSSSIIWPYLMAPFTLTSFGSLAPLLFGILFASLTSLICLHITLNELSERISENKTVALVLFITIIFNSVTIIFMGLETTLQMLLTALFAALIIKENKTQHISNWIVFIAFLLILTRYEALAIIVPSVMYLWFRKHQRVAIYVTLVCVLGVALFSFYLTSLGLHPVPSSIVVKSSAVLTTIHPLIDSITSRLFRIGMNLASIKNISLIIFLAFLIKKAPLDKNKRSLLYLVASAFTLQMLMGKSGIFSLNRYESYMHVFMFLCCIYIASDIISDWLTRRYTPKKTLSLYAFAFLLSFDTFAIMLLTPLGANNIYEQQYQMHRFVTEFYPHNVGVNDLGWVAYQNDHYVLDFFGLASLEAFNARSQFNADKSRLKLSNPNAPEINPDWMVSLTQQKNVRLAMIYDQWLDTPSQWQKLATLSLSGQNFTSAERKVSFYLTQNTLDGTQEKQALTAFKASLPNNVTLELEDN